MNYTHFTQNERNELSILLKKGYSHRDIGKCLGKNHSSVSREIAKNSVNGEYESHKANHKSYVRRKYSKYVGMKIRNDAALENYVQDKVRLHWSPDEISGRIRETDKHILYVSALSIYKYLYSRYGQSLCCFLYSRRYKIKRRKEKKKSIRELIPNRISIEERPVIVARRKRFGDFEGDTLGRIKTDKEAIAGLTERLSRKVFLGKIPRLKFTVDEFRNRLDLYSDISESLTLDNGVENVRYEKLGIDTFFCHLYSSWEKGTMENSFNRLRRFIPKGASLKNYSEADIQRFENLMNKTPRKCLEYRTPNEVFEEQLLLKRSKQNSYSNLSTVVHLTI